MYSSWVDGLYPSGMVVDTGPDIKYSLGITIRYVQNYGSVIPPHVQHLCASPCSYYIVLESAPFNLTSVPEREDATLNAADNNVAGLEIGIDGPCTVEGSFSSNIVVGGINIEETDFLETCAGIVLIDGGDVNHAQARAVVGLV